MKTVLFWYARNNYGYSHFKFCKSDQHPGVALILTMFPQWHIGEYPGVRVNQPGEMITVCGGVPLLLQVHQIWAAWFRWVGADNLVNIVCVICNKLKCIALVYDNDVYTSSNQVLESTYITFIQRLFNFVQLLIKHGELLFSVSMLLFLHLKCKGSLQ